MRQVQVSKWSHLSQSSTAYSCQRVFHSTETAHFWRYRRSDFLASGHTLKWWTTESSNDHTFKTAFASHHHLPQLVQSLCPTWSHHYQLRLQGSSFAVNFVLSCFCCWRWIMYSCFAPISNSHCHWFRRIDCFELDCFIIESIAPYFLYSSSFGSLFEQVSAISKPIITYSMSRVSDSAQSSAPWNQKYYENRLSTCPGHLCKYTWQISKTGCCFHLNFSDFVLADRMVFPPGLLCYLWFRRLCIRLVNFSSWFLEPWHFCLGRFEDFDSGWSPHQLRQVDIDAASALSDPYVTTSKCGCGCPNCPR